MRLTFHQYYAMLDGKQMHDWQQTARLANLINDIRVSHRNLKGAKPREKHKNETHFNPMVETQNSNRNIITPRTIHVLKAYAGLAVQGMSHGSVQGSQAAGPA